MSGSSLLSGTQIRLLRRIITLSLIGMTLPSCILVPQPHDLIGLSRVEGVLFAGDTPAANMALTMNALSNHTTCDNPIAGAKTDARGFFVFPEIKARKTWRMVTLAPSSPTYSMTICLHHQGKVAPIFHQQIWAAPPTQLVLECVQSDALVHSSMCQISNWSGYNYLRGSEDYGQCRPESPTSMRVLEGGKRVSCERN